MDIDSLFQQICCDLKSNGTDIRDISDKFRSCSSDWERIRLVLQMQEVTARLRESLEQATLETSKPGKDENLSTSHRVEGNHYYQKKLNSKAISCYNQSLLVGDGESLALAYANRSAAFHDTADWFHSLRDIELALYHGYPKHLEHKLRERQGHCWLKLGNTNQAFISYSRARDLLVSSDKIEPGKLASIASKLCNLGDIIIEVSESINIQAIEQDIIKKRRLAPELNRERNHLLPSASTSVQLTDTLGRGRCLVATQDLKPGTNVIVEKAFASILLEEFKQSHCHHCLHWTPGPVPCLRCSQVVFCSTICRDRSWSSYHQSECGLTDLLHRSNVGKHGLLALRTVLKVDRKTLEDAQDQSPANQVYDSGDYGTIHRLVGNTSQRSVADLFHRSVMAVYLINLVRKGPDDLLSTCVLRLLQSYPCNAHEIAQLAVPPPSSPTEVVNVHSSEIGAAAMPVLSLINHSCDPNVVRVCYGDVIVVKVIRRIERGQELLDNYGYHYATHARTERQSKLERQYYFRCCCPPCVQDWPGYNDIPELANRPEISDALQEDLTEFCHQQSCYPDDPDQVEKWASKFVGYIDAMDSDPSIRLPVREYNMAQEALKRCFELLATLSPHVS